MEPKQTLHFRKLKSEFNIPCFIHNHEGLSEAVTTKRVNKQFNIMISLFAHIPFMVILERFAFTFACNSFNCGPSPSRVTARPNQLVQCKPSG